MDVINSDIDLIKETIACDYIRVYHFEEKVKCNDKKEYKINIICCEFNNEKDLDNNWKTIVDNVALYIQSKLEKHIELYNVYIIFFINKINEYLISKIEQNKYSSRKIVIKGQMPKNINEIKNIISKRLFYFNIEKSKEVFSISDILKKTKNELYEYLNDKEKIKESDIDKIVDILVGGELID